MATNEQEHLKLCMAREIYRSGCIDRLLPSVVEFRVKYPRRKHINKTWRDWWRERFGDEYEDYVEVMKNVRASKNTE